MIKEEKHEPKPTILELDQGKDKREEERFFDRFSNIQIQSILILILAITFLMNSISNYFPDISRVMITKIWIMFILFALVFLMVSIFSITMSNVIRKLEKKKYYNTASFFTFIVGITLFFISLIFLMIGFLSQ